MVECTLSITHCLQLHTVDLVRTCRISSFCTVAWQLARFQLTRRIARSLCDSWASCRDIASCLWKVTDYHLLNLYLAPRLGLTTFEFQQDVCCQKTRLPWLLGGVISMIQCLAISVQLRLVTDTHTRQTDTDTWRQRIPRDQSSRAKNYFVSTLCVTIVWFQRWHSGYGDRNSSRFSRWTRHLSHCFRDKNRRKCYDGLLQYHFRGRPNQ